MEPGYCRVLTVLIPPMVGVVSGAGVQDAPGCCSASAPGPGGDARARRNAGKREERGASLGYGVAYAVGNVLLALWGNVIVALL